MILYISMMLLSAGIMKMMPTIVSAPPSLLSSKSSVISASVQATDNYRLFLDYQKSDEVGVVRDKLDAFAKQLQGEIQSDAWILSYAGKRACVAEAKRRADVAKRYLVSKGIRGERIKVVDAGFHEEWAVELWLVIRGTPGPPSTSSVKPEEVQIIKKRAKCPKAKL
jgi:hypothetical protein